MTIPKQVEEALENLKIELPSWAFGNSGTRFGVFGTAGTPRNPYEKLEDAAQVNKYTGSAPKVSLHIPWDYVEDFQDLKKHADELGVEIGTINSNVFQDEEYKFGSLCSVDPTIRRKAIDHHKFCIDVMRKTGSRDLKIWLADGTNYPGQDSIRERQDRLHESLSEIYSELDDNMRLILEYKFFEPAFYHTDVPDWGTALVQCKQLGDRAKVVLDTGHHAPGTNIEFIVAQLTRLHMLGAFDFNSRFYADDDLMVGAADPFQLFRIMFEILSADALSPETEVNFMLDQCHNLEEKIPGEIQSVLNVQEATAKAALVDVVKLREMQEKHDVLGANRVFMDAYLRDVRPILAEWRKSRGIPSDPYVAFMESGYLDRVRSDRVGGEQAGWGA